MVDNITSLLVPLNNIIDVIEYLPLSTMYYEAFSYLSFLFFYIINIYSFFFCSLLLLSLVLLMSLIVGRLAGTTLRSLTDLTQDIVDNITIVKVSIFHPIFITPFTLFGSLWLID